MSADRTLASFRSQARGIMFYDVPASTIFVGQHFSCHLDISNVHDVNSVSILIAPHFMLGHLAREAALYLAPLLRAGFQASG